MSEQAAGNAQNASAPKAAAPSVEEAVDFEAPLKQFSHRSYDDYYDHPMKGYPLTSRLFLGFVVCVCGAFTKLLWQWKMVNGRDQLWNGGEGKVLVMNHVSMVDPVAVIVSLWWHGIRLRTVYKSEFNKIPGAKLVFSRAGAIPVERGTADIKAVRRCQRALKRGECVLIYPEGTRIRPGEEPGEIHGGFALMAQMGRAAVQPIAIVGPKDFKLFGKKWKRPGRCYIKAGEPITFAELGVKKRKDQIEAMEKLAVERMFALRDELRAEHPGKV